MAEEDWLEAEAPVEQVVEVAVLQMREALLLRLLSTKVEEKKGLDAGVKEDVTEAGWEVEVDSKAAVTEATEARREVVLCKCSFGTDSTARLQRMS